MKAPDLFNHVLQVKKSQTPRYSCKVEIRIITNYGTTEAVHDVSGILEICTCCDGLRYPWRLRHSHVADMILQLHGKVRFDLLEDFECFQHDVLMKFLFVKDAVSASSRTARLRQHRLCRQQEQSEKHICRFHEVSCRLIA
jgi:hypothetical protein